ncbi:NAD(P)-binding protein, partial [Streptomyces sp. SID10244]|nr:NAD(P)-binding protein [Streptomyces sp. SID10244]
MAGPATEQTAIVIGTGFGGSVAALRLGRAGIRTTVFERGRRWPIRPDGDTFATFTNPDKRAAWFGSPAGAN